MSGRLRLALTALLALGGCAAGQGGAGKPMPAAGETIGISVGPCFGFCPVYDVSVSPDGTIAFTGRRHTAVLGERRRSAGPATYRSLARDLAPFRPADGTEARVSCEAAISDTPSYTITWNAAGGRKTTATHQGGCPDGPGKALDAVLRQLPEQLGITDWTTQIARPGASRG